MLRLLLLLLLLLFARPALFVLLPPLLLPLLPLLLLLLPPPLLLLLLLLLATPGISTVLQPLPACRQAAQCAAALVTPKLHQHQLHTWVRVHPDGPTRS
jgi:hypothetical protein